jgi:hypothetical protein
VDRRRTIRKGTGNDAFCSLAGRLCQSYSIAGAAKWTSPCSKITRPEYVFATEHAGYSKEAKMEVLVRYCQLTGFAETNICAIAHHVISL